MLIRGYWNSPEATAEAIVDGWLRTGDLGRLDDEGFIYVEDRAKDMVIRAGENIYCAEVEAAIYDHPAVYEAAVFGIPHPRLGEELVAAVLLKPGQPLDEAELQAHVRERLAGFKVPSRVVFVDEQLPRGATGKILKRELRDAGGRGHLVSPATAGRADQTVLVTGANSGIGLATTSSWPAAATDAVGTVRSKAKATVVHQAARPRRGRGRHLQLDVTDAVGCERTSWPASSSTGWSTTPATP